MDYSSRTYAVHWTSINMSAYHLQSNGMLELCHGTLEGQRYQGGNSNRVDTKAQKNIPGCGRPSTKVGRRSQQKDEATVWQEGQGGILPTRTYGLFMSSTPAAKVTRYMDWLGHMVCLYPPYLQLKLQGTWIGPYEVIKQISSVTYVVAVPECRKQRRTVHVSMMKPQTTPVARVSNVVQIDEENSEEEEPASTVPTP